MAICLGVAALKKDGIGHLGPSQRKTFLGRNGAAAMKRIDIRGEIPVVEFENEMARQADPEYRHMQAPRDFHVHHSQSDGDAGPALQHLVQAAIEGVEKITLVTVETQLAEQVAAGFFDEVASVIEITEAIPQRRGQIIQLVQERLRLEIREMDGGQIQCRAVHADPGSLLCQDLLQMEQMIHLLLLYYPACRISQPE